MKLKYSPSSNGLISTFSLLLSFFLSVIYLPGVKSGLGVVLSALATASKILLASGAEAAYASKASYLSLASASRVAYASRASYLSLASASLAAYAS